MVTRWGTGKQAGYVVGPRSVHASGAEYRPAEGTSFDIATLPEAWARAAVEGEGEDIIRIGGRPDPAEVAVGHRHDFLRDTARYYSGTVRDPDALFAAVWAANEKLAQPKTEDEVRRAIGDVLTRFPADPVEEDPETGETRRVFESSDDPGMLVYDHRYDDLPAPPPDVAYEGPLGECARHLAAGTDASPVALLASLIAFCGPLVPIWGYWNGSHTSSPFIALVGKAAVGRKGTAMYRVRDALALVLGTPAVNGVRFDGLASGEALVKAMLDRDRETRGTPTGLLFEEEYASFLAAAGRDGSSLDPRMRGAFDGKQMSHRKVGETIVVREPYWLAGLIAITPSELQERVGKASFRNGTNNRWLWLAVQRRDERVTSSEPYLPDHLGEVLREAHLASKHAPRRCDPTPEADDLLGSYDAYLRIETTGMAADMTRRLGTIAYRIGLVHAAVEKAARVTLDHVRRAIALCEYGRASLPFVFGETLADQASTHLLRMLRQSEGGNLSQTTLSRAFMRDPIKRQVVIDDLQRLGLAEVVRVGTGGRPRTELHLTDRDPALFRGFGALFSTPTEETHTPNAPKAASKRAPTLKTSVQEAAPKGRERGAKGAPKSAEVWCRDVAAHASSHRDVLTDSPWCLICSPKDPEETP
jgi:hypothetical protein